MFSEVDFTAKLQLYAEILYTFTITVNDLGAGAEPEDVATSALTATTNIFVTGTHFKLIFL